MRKTLPLSPASRKSKPSSQSMRLTVTTVLETDADTAWWLMKKTSTFLFLVRGLLGLSRSSDLPQEWTEGYELRTRLWFFHVLPAWRHELRILAVDETGRFVKTDEHSGLLAYRHTLAVEPISQSICRYSDTLELDDGLPARLAWPILQVFFRYRQMRLRKMVRSLIKLPPALETA